MNGEGKEGGLSKKSYSVEDITAALDDMVQNNEYINESLPPSKSAAPAATKAQPELDALSKALQGFSAEEETDG